MTSQLIPVSELAINVSLVAYNCRISDRKPRQLLTVLKLNKQPQITARLSDKENITEIPAIGPSQEEKIRDDDSIVGVWVGMRPSAALEHIGTKVKGSSVNTHKGLVVIDYDPTALRVIAPLGKETATYYALADPENGVCQAYHTPLEEVFFFPEFRDDSATSVQTRKDNWGKLVRDTCQAKQRDNWPKDYDKTKFIVPLKRSIANDISCLVTYYQDSGSTMWLEKAKDLIENASGKEEYYHPIGSNVNLSKLTTPKILDEAESKLALKELEVLAPDLSVIGIEAEELRQMSEGLTKANIVLEYRLLRAFIVEFIRTFRSNTYGDLLNMARKARDHVVLQIGPVVMNPERSRDGLERFVDAEITAITAIESHVPVLIQALKDSQGSNPFSGSPSMPQIWNKFGAAPDLDSAKLYGSMVHRYNVDAVSSILHDIQGLLKKHIGRLNEFRKTMVDEEEH